MESSFLELAPYLSLYSGDDASSAGPSKTSRGTNGSIDRLVSQRTQLLKSKLEVFAAAISQRFVIRAQNLRSLEYDDLLLSKTLLYFEPTSGAGLYRPGFPEKLYVRRFEISKERREQDVECWRDVVMVMRDFLVTWEALEQSRARAIFLNHD